jgi:hypothetical protein
MKINDDSVLKKRETILERLGDELLLFDSSVGKLFEVNETGKIIWEMLNGQHSVGAIKKILREEFEEANELDDDIEEFLDRLIQLSILDVTS